MAADTTTTKSTKKRRGPELASSLNRPELPFKSHLKPDSSILKSLESLLTATTNAASTLKKLLTLSDLSLSATCHEMTDLSLSSVWSEIESLVRSIASSILSGDGLSFNIPHPPPRTGTTFRPVAHISSVRKATMTTKILSLIHLLCRKGIQVTKRDLFHTDVKLFQDQTQSDAVLDDVLCILGCARSSLNVVAAEKGVAVGRWIFSDSGDMIDSRELGIGGKAIPPNIDRVVDMQSGALFILWVEQE